jgi:hypothetical protein
MDCGFFANVATAQSRLSSPIDERPPQHRVIAQAARRQYQQPILRKVQSWASTSPRNMCNK